MTGDSAAKKETDRSVQLLSEASAVLNRSVQQHLRASRPKSTSFLDLSDCVSAADCPQQSVCTVMVCYISNALFCDS